VPPDTVKALAEQALAESAALLPGRFLQWFAARGWLPRAHQLELL